MNYMKWVFLYLLVLAGIHESKACLEVERSALLEFKLALVNSECYDGDHLLPSWEDDPRSDCCDWERVTCDRTTGHIMELSLDNISIDIPIDSPPCFFNISMFQDLNELLLLNLSYNAISGWTHNKGFENSPKLSKLKQLDLSYNLIPENSLSFIGKLSSLEFLDLSYNFIDEPFPVHEIYGLSNLMVLLLARSFNGGSLSFQNRTVLRKLQVLDLSYNYLESFSIEFGALTSLMALSVAGNGLNETTFSALCGLMILEKLDLHRNDFTVVPQCSQNLTTLKLLDLSHNRINGQLPTSWMSRLTSIKYFDIRENSFQGVLLLSMFRNHSQLEVVAIGEQYSYSNGLIKVETEETDWIPNFQLRVLILPNCNLNMINHRVPKFLLYQRNLRYVDLSHNNLQGRVPDWLLYNNSRMQGLILCNNSFTGDLYTLLHPTKELRTIDVSENQMQGMLPEIVGNILPSLEHLILSSNAFRGNLPASIGLLRNLSTLDLSFNKFKGEVPETIFNCTNLAILKLSQNEFCGNFFSPRYNWSNLIILMLRDNNFTGSMSNVKVFNSYDLAYFDISNNSMFGRVPTWIANMSGPTAVSLRNNYLEGEVPCEVFGNESIRYVDLSQNFLSGTIPSCSGTNYLQQIHLESNNFSGLIPNALLNYSELLVLNLRDNRLSGNIPDMIGEVSNLKVLLLGKNQLSGSIPKNLCLLKKIFLMDVSHNLLSGSIPHCFGNVGFGGLYNESIVSFSTYDTGVMPNIDMGFANLLKKKDFGVIEDYNEFEVTVFSQVDFLVKNRYNTYKGDILDIMSGLDLSCNNLVGEIPLELGNLSQIQAINISHNHLSGSIPTTFANLTQIESLDLSHNNLTGEISFQLTQLNFMEVFSVAHNNLSGKIPYGKAQFGTFDSSSYEGNPLLCGQPLMRNCSGNNEPVLPPKPNDNDDGHWFDIDLVMFFSSFAASFFIFFLGVIAFLYVNSYWREWLFYYGEKVVLFSIYFVSDILF